MLNLAGIPVPLLVPLCLRGGNLDGPTNRPGRGPHRIKTPPMQDVKNRHFRGFLVPLVVPLCTVILYVFVPLCANVEIERKRL
jgi:hypothetical protein